MLAAVVTSPYAAPFFQRATTRAAIERIRSSSRLVIYAGAGVTIDKSDLNWSALIEGLLRPHIPNKAARRKFVREEAPLFAASAAAQFFLESSDEEQSEDQLADARQRMVDTLRPMLYGPGTWRSGDLAPAIADFVYLWNTTGAAGTAKERCACVVTTNYDDYVFAALKVAYESRIKRASKEKIALVTPEPRVIFPSDEDPLTNASASLAEWVSEQKLPSRDLTACIHLHGYVPRNPRSSLGSFREPVVSENDYYRTARHSEQALISLFTDSAVVIAGASVTDAPLIRALESTVASGHARYCLVALTPPEPGSSMEFFDEQRRMIKARLAGLNIEPIYADYHVQHAQFFRELAAAAESSKKRSGAAGPDKRSYYNRLGSWWRKLGAGKSEASAFDMQIELHEDLALSILPAVKDCLASGEEHLKLEIWLRWDPTVAREFRLFGSSVGIWADTENMRSVLINGVGGNIIGDAFREGRPILRESSQGPEVRWATWLAVPIWSESHETAFVSSVMVLASRSSISDSALNEGRNRAAIAECVRVMQDAGNAMTDPVNWTSSS